MQLSFDLCMLTTRLLPFGQAFSMLGYAREKGVHSFWSDKPAEGGYMVWSGIDGQPLNVTAGERRCVLVSTLSTDQHAHMYAELRPCHMRMADGVVCESASAARTLHVFELYPCLHTCYVTTTCYWTH
jgi:hypothetical protein